MGGRVGKVVAEGQGCGEGAREVVRVQVGGEARVAM